MAQQTKLKSNVYSGVAVIALLAYTDATAQSYPGNIRFDLWDPDANQKIVHGLSDNDVIDPALFQNGNFTVIARYFEGGDDSASFSVNGGSYTHAESSNPYSLYNDGGWGNLFGQPIPTTPITITANIHTTPDGTGPILDTRTITLTPLGYTGPSTYPGNIRFDLWDPDANQKIVEGLSDNDVIDASLFQNGNFTVIARYFEGGDDSATFSVDGGTPTAADGSNPYSLYGDNGWGNLFGQSIPAAPITLTANIYATPNGTGSLLDTRTIILTPSGLTAVPAFAIGDAIAEEGSDLVFSVYKSGAHTSPIVLNYSVADDTATSPADYSAQSGTVTFAPTDTFKTITVSTVQDTLSEGAETLSVTISENTGPTNIIAAQGNGTINEYTSPSGTYNEQTDYAYDDLGRLLRVNFDDGQAIRFTYDPAGNRTRVQQGGALDTFDDAVNVAFNASVYDFDPTINDIIIDPAVVSISSVGSPLHGGSVTIDPNDPTLLHYTPATGQTEFDFFSYTITDGQFSRSGDVAITIVQNNAAPIADDETVNLNEDAPTTTIDVLNGDTDPDGASLQISAISSPANGFATIKNGAIEYTPNPNFFGVDTIKYTASDGVLDDLAVVTVNVASVNDIPIVSSLSASTLEDTALLLNLGDFVSDVETPTVGLNIQATQPAKGIVAISGANLTYTPDQHYSGADSFTYTANDGEDTSSSASVTITVTEVTDPIVANPDSLTIIEDAPATVINIGANDLNPDNLPYTVVIHQQGNKGNATVINNNEISYRPNINQNGSDSFQYEIVNANGPNSIATVTISITPVNDPPQGGVDNPAVTNFDVDNDWTQIAGVTVGETDPDGDPVTLSSIGNQPAFGESRISGSVVQFRCDGGCPNWVDQVQVHYNVTDGQATVGRYKVVNLQHPGSGGPPN